MGPELHLDVPAPEKMTVMTTAAPSLPKQEHLALAVDLGTTSLYWRLIAVPDVREEPAPDDFSLLCRPPLPVSVVAEGHDLNPKAGPGSPGWYVTIWRPCCGSRRPPCPTSLWSGWYWRPIRP